NILTPCVSWSSPVHLAVEEIRSAPAFRRSLRHVKSSHGKAEPAYFRGVLLELLDLTRYESKSACVIITRPPEILACFCIFGLSGPLFVIFDSHPRPRHHPDGAAFIFENSADGAAEYLAELLHYDEHLLADSNLQWQAQLLSHCSGDFFLAPEASVDDGDWSEVAFDSSLQMLRLQARVRELEDVNENLQSENKRLQDETSELEDRLSELDDELERLKKCEDLKRAERPVDTGLNTSPHFPSPASTTASGTRTNGHQSPWKTQGRDGDLAFDLQRQFDEEDRRLQLHYRFLQDTEPATFDCGICFDCFQEDFVVRLLPCRHAFCRDCVRGYVVNAIESHRYPITCPTCSAGQEQGEMGEVDDAAVQQLGLMDKQYDIYSEMQLAPFSTIIHCRKCKEAIFVDKTEYQEVQTIVCPLRGCGHVWCKMCSQAIQIGGPKHSCDGSSELQHLMGQHGWKNCPGARPANAFYSGCQTPAEKTEGCNHMTCISPSCNTHFCYVCGELIVQSVRRTDIQSAVSKHYSKCRLF
ncbi:uncharacterized protein BXZ73DRAFT_56145, partial [Epithele typhae]|uniref:uncharacterized protein n=1 Tax=Epithele typhae TaxID=378194 RepID=UPI002007BA33